jgi:DNA-binding NtrC family response regulator
MKRGACDFLTKPFDRRTVVEVIGKALAQAGRARGEFQGPLDGNQKCGMVGRSQAIESLRSLIERIAPTPATVLIAGETGTGKELVAEALHHYSARRNQPLVRVNCGALPETLVESELFGAERGAFTGADRTRPGRFELADGGTLFLDEIGEMPPAIQVKLLRVLQDGVVDRVGGSKPIRVDVRLITASHRDLDAETRHGSFRADLLYRLRVVEIRVPALRDRPEDVPLLVEFFLDKHSRRLGRPRPSVSVAALAALSGMPWPGNVRQLENAVERAVVLAAGPVLELEDFGIASVLQPAGAPPGGPVDLKDAARAAAAETERRLILEALQACGHNVTRASERLGLSRRGLQIKMKEFGLRTET